MPTKTYIVTGVAGFIGSHVAEQLLQRGDDVVGIDQVNDYYSLKQKHGNLQILNAFRSFHFYKADCADNEAMMQIFKSHKPQVVIHLAARAGVRPSIDEPQLYIHSNITATTNLLEVSRIHHIKNFVYASSSSGIDHISNRLVYGENSKVPFTESDRTDSPLSQYAATKKACELFASTYSHLYNLPTTGLRFFTVYGPRGRPDMAPFKFVDHIINGRPIPVYGDGSSSRDYTYIDDIVSGVISASGKIYSSNILFYHIDANS